MMSDTIFTIRLTVQNDSSKTPRIKFGIYGVGGAEVKMIYVKKGLTHTCVLRNEV